MAEIVQADYEQLSTIGGRFRASGGQLAQMRRQLRQRISRLRGSWQGVAATAFFTEWEHQIDPAVLRLVSALEQAGHLTERMSQRVAEAEQEAARLFGSPVRQLAAQSNDEPALPQWLQDLIETAILGDFTDTISLPGILAQIGIGFIPIAGQIADIRDIIAGIINVLEGEEMSGVFLAISIAAIIPGLDSLKAARIFKPILKALGDKGTREVLEYIAKNPQELGRVSEILQPLLTNPKLIQTLADNPDQIMPLLRTGNGDVIKAIANSGDDSGYIVSQYQRLAPLASDPAHIGKVSDKALREGGVGLALEGRGTLPGPIVRDPTGAAEFIDANKQAWDVKTFNSNFPNSFQLTRHMEDIRAEIGIGENIILDTRDLSPSDLQRLHTAITAAGLDSHIVWYP